VPLNLAVQCTAGDAV